MTASCVLYDYWRSSASYRVRIALALKGLAYERRTVDLVSGAQRGEAHLARNPQGLVPVFECGGLRLTQSLAIIEYLDETVAGPKLLPGDAEARAEIRAIAQAIACEIHPVSNLHVLARIEALAGQDARAAWNRDNIASGLEAVEIMLDRAAFTGRYAHGDTPTMADCALVPQLYNATRWEVDYTHLPRISAVARTCAAHPAFMAAHPDHFDPSLEARVTEEERR